MPAYKEYCSEGMVTWHLKRSGTANAEELAAWVRETGGRECGVDADGVFEWSVFNREGRWDNYTILEEETARGSDLAELPSSVVTPDGIWRSEMDFGNKPRLDWEYGGLHPDNELPHA